MINSLLVTINQLLPLAVLVVFASTLCTCSFTKKALPWVIAALLLPCFIYIFTMEQISQWFGFLGFEYSQIVLLLVIALSALVGLAIQHWLPFVVLLSSALSLYSSHYIPWLLQGDFDASRGLGLFLGIGIVVSFAVLLWFFLQWLNTRYGPLGVVILFGMHIAGSMVAMLDIAAGAGLFTMPAAFTDLRFLLQEQSVVGRLAKVVLGYEATPSLLSGAVYATTLCSLVGVFAWRRRCV
ncbi:hypothetical protein AAEU32_11385 [Pseudoalteromonas sp. SSDWG2]|uniref:hypothetical protein n=1 Tax=Pseudoalteromonas sp. SSDWG2 TaxID=3139391 RepID=UPI003BAC6E1A